MPAIDVVWLLNPMQIQQQQLTGVPSCPHVHPIVCRGNCVDGYCHLLVILKCRCKASGLFLSFYTVNWKASRLIGMEATTLTFKRKCCWNTQTSFLYQDPMGRNRINSTVNQIHAVHLEPSKEDKSNVLVQPIVPVRSVLSHIVCVE